MSFANLTVVDLVSDGADTLVQIAVGAKGDRYFSPILAAQLMIDVDGLVQQACITHLEPRGALGAKEGQARGPRRWAFAQEIFSNEGRGTESGHFLEHLVLEAALSVVTPSRARRFAGETTWNWRTEPNLYRLRFFNMDQALVRSSLALSANALGHRDYLLDLGAAPVEKLVAAPRAVRAARAAR
ncbi:MAG: hypothetical protein WCJ30_14590 [Deltaproteobacteria bacterium]